MAFDEPTQALSSGFGLSDGDLTSYPIPEPATAPRPERMIRG